MDSNIPYHMHEHREESSSRARTRTNPFSNYGRYQSVAEGLSTFARVDEDGQIGVSVNLWKPLPKLPEHHYDADTEYLLKRDPSSRRDVPRMRIMIMIVGSRGDVQPYIALGKKLQGDGHRVRIGTHATFHDFVTGSGLEFYPIGGDPAELMSYMVKNPGLMPGVDSLVNGDIGRKRSMLAAMIHGCWAACHAPCPDTGHTFMADAIISNPPTFAHIHCAEALGIPLHMTFTMPWSPTTAFSHPLVNVMTSNAGLGMTNYLSYTMSELLTWHGIGDLVNHFRKRTLGLHSLTSRNGPGILNTLQIPWTYCMSSALVPKPKDWKNNIDIVGFYFLDLAKDYTPPDDLASFLAAGPPPIYIGFGSVVVADPAAMTDILFRATEAAGVRALISAGWGGLGGVSVPSHVFILGNVPHDWLFSEGRVSAVVHHAGAGTTAAGLSKGLPTVTVPFFGDQKFWGDMINRAGAGPSPIPQKKLSVEVLTSAIQFALSPSAKLAARAMADQIHHENGVKEGVQSFYQHLPLDTMRCDLVSSRVAVWWWPEQCLKLSAFAAQVLIDERKLDPRNLRKHKTKEYNTKATVRDPVAGDVIDEIHRGFQTMPTLYGSDVRPAGEVTGIGSGISEGAKALFYGYYDSIVGLYKEPFEGAKKDGLKGAVLGAGRSLINVAVKPVAGAVGFVAYPYCGAKKSISAVHSSMAQSSTTKNFPMLKKDKKKPSPLLPCTRVADGIEAVKTAEKNAIVAVLNRFTELQATLRNRQTEYAKMAAGAVEGSDRAKVSGDKDSELRSSFAEPGSFSSTTRPTSSRSSASSNLLAHSSNTDINLPLPRYLPPRPPTHPSQPYGIPQRSQEEALRVSSASVTAYSHMSPQEEQDEEAFQHALDMAIRLSMAES